MKTKPLSIHVSLYMYRESLWITSKSMDTQIVYGHHFHMRLMKMTLISMFSQMKLFCQGFFFIRCSTTFDFSGEYIFFYVLAVLAEHELPTKEYIDAPPVYKSRSDQMVAGLMLGLQQQQSFQSMQQHSSEMYNNRAVKRTTATRCQC